MMAVDAPVDEGPFLPLVAPRRIVWAGAVTAYLDGDDLCAGCGRCCHDVEGLRTTAEELDRLELMVPYVSREQGAFRIVDIPGPCPYLGDDLRCTVFEQRPFDCSLYPVNVLAVDVRPDRSTAEVRWNLSAAECPERPAFVGMALAKGLDDVGTWVAIRTGADRVEFRAEHWTRLRARRDRLLHTFGLLRPLRRLIGRPLPTKPVG